MVYNCNLRFSQRVRMPVLGCQRVFFEAAFSLAAFASGQICPKNAECEFWCYALEDSQVIFSLFNAAEVLYVVRDPPRS